MLRRIFNYFGNQPARGKTETRALSSPEEQNVLHVANTVSPDGPFRQPTDADEQAKRQRNAYAKKSPRSMANITSLGHRACEISVNKLSTINVIGRYHLLRTLGMGSHSEVKLAHDIATGKEVAVKEIKHAWLPRVFFLQEALVMQLMEHPNIVKCYHHEQSTRTLLFVMEYANGGSLKDLLGANWRLKEADAKKVFEQLVDALRYCHKRKVAYVDLKPSNILLTADGTVKLAYFGRSAKYLLTPTVCDPRYVAPEVLKKMQPGPKSDVWSLGVILYQMVTGTTPFAGVLPADVLRNISEKSYPAPSGVSNACTTLLEQLLVEDPGHRASLYTFAMDKWLIRHDSPQSDKTRVQASGEDSSQGCCSCTFYRLMGREACTFKHVREIRVHPLHQKVASFPICSSFLESC